MWEWAVAETPQLVAAADLQADVLKEGKSKVTESTFAMLKLMHPDDTLAYLTNLAERLQLAIDDLDDPLYVACWISIPRACGIRRNLRK